MVIRNHVFGEQMRRDDQNPLGSKEEMGQVTQRRAIEKGRVWGHGLIISAAYGNEMSREVSVGVEEEQTPSQQRNAEREERAPRGCLCKFNELFL